MAALKFRTEYLNILYKFLAFFKKKNNIAHTKFLKLYEYMSLKNLDSQK